MGLEIGSLTPTDAAKDLDHRSIPAHNLEYTKTVVRTLKPDLERCFNGQAAPPVDTHTMNYPREGLTQADEQGDSIRLELLQGVTEISGRSKEAIRQTISRGPLNKDSGESVSVSTNPNLFGEDVPG